MNLFRRLPSNNLLALSRAGRAAALGLGLATAFGCAKLDPFGAELGKVNVGQKVVRAPYLSTLQYFGHLESGTHATEDVDGRPMQAVYVWLPAATTEVGVRLVSPSRGYAKPKKQDVQSQGWLAHKRDKKGFSPTVVVQRCASITDPTDPAQSCPEWLTLGQGEPVYGPRAKKGQKKDLAEVRLAPHPDDVRKNLVRGVYRVAVADFAEAGAEGTFFVQVATPNVVEGAAIAGNLGELATAVKGKVKELPQVPGIGPAHTPHSQAADKSADTEVKAPNPGPLGTPTPAPLHDTLAPPAGGAVSPQAR